MTRQARNPAATASLAPPAPDGLPGLLAVLGARWRLLAGGTLMAGALAVAAGWMIAPVHTARTSLLPPQQAPGTVASVLASLGGLGSLVGGGTKTPADRELALLQSTTVADRLIDQFQLTQVYHQDGRQDTRRELARHTRAGASRTDGLVTLEVDDTNPQRAAAIANQYLAELHHLSQRLAQADAQQRRQFYEGQRMAAGDALAQAQQALLASGVTADVLNGQPKAAAEAHAQRQAALTTARAQLAALRRGLTSSAPEVQQAEAAIAVLSSGLSRREAGSAPADPSNHVSSQRELKQQAWLSEHVSHQHELAGLDEARGHTLQVVDAAQPPERPSWPRPGLMGAIGATSGLALLLAWVLGTARKRSP